MAPSILHSFFFLHSSRPCPIFFTSQAPFFYISSPILYISSPILYISSPVSFTSQAPFFFISIWLLFCVIASLLHHNTFSFSPHFPLILTTFSFHSSPLSLSFFPSFPSLFLCLATFVYILLHCTSTICVVRKYLNG